MTHIPALYLHPQWHDKDVRKEQKQEKKQEKGKDILLMRLGKKGIDEKEGKVKS